MYCRHCGAELKDGARFCASCGAEVAAESAAIEAAPAANETGASFGEAVDRGKRRSMRKMSPLLAIALTLALAAGTAFAAYYVYTEVIEPANQGETGEGPGAQTDFDTTHDYEMDSHVIEVKRHDGEMQEVTILYPQFSVNGDGSDDAVDAVNKMIRTDAESLDFEVNRFAASGVGVFTASAFSYTVEYDLDGVVSLRRPTYFRVGELPRGVPLDSLTFDMTTGERLSAASAVGLSDDELTDYAYEAIDCYATNKGWDLSTSDYKTHREWTVRNSGPCFYLDDKGVVMAPGPYFLAEHYADKEIYVYAFEDQSIVGTCAHNRLYGTS